MLVGAGGVNNKIYIYDVKGGSDAMVSLSGHEGSITSLQFSENGYYLATAGDDGKVGFPFAHIYNSNMTSFILLLMLF